MSKKNNVKTLDQFVDEQYGKKGTSKRDKFEKGYETFKLGFLIQQARLNGSVIVSPSWVYNCIECRERLDFSIYTII